MGFRFSTYNAQNSVRVVSAPNDDINALRADLQTLRMDATLKKELIESLQDKLAKAGLHLPDQGTFLNGSL